MAKFSLLTAVCLALAAPHFTNIAGAAPDEMYQGKIAAIADRMITVVTRRGENVSFAVPIDCMIRLDGKQVSLTMLGMGNTVFISAVRERGIHTAKHVEARSVEHKNQTAPTKGRLRGLKSTGLVQLQVH